MVRRSAIEVTVCVPLPVKLYTLCNPNYNRRMPHVQRDGNRITVPTLSDPFVVGNFLRAMYSGVNAGYEEYILDLQPVDGAFPNVCAPIAGIIDFYRLRRGFDFRFENVPEYVDRTNLLEPSGVGENERAYASPLDVVWRFSTPEDTTALVDAFLESVSKSAVCEEGVIQGLEWCINEVMDNVLQHSNENHGYAMGQIHRTSQHIAVCIYDFGQGLYNSLRNTSHAPRSAVDAITLSIREGVTRDASIGQGNGMWGLHNIVRANSGLLRITSGNGFYGLRGDDVTTSTNVPFLDRDNNCTCVDFQIDFDKGIAISEALGGYEPLNMRLDALEDFHGNVTYPLADKTSGTGTRRSGEAIRNDILNVSREAKKVVVIDFDGVSVVSSSFADELLGKLVASVGFIEFNSRFRLANMNDFVEAVANRSIAQRLGQGSRGGGVA